jgi:hypothetical protein
VTRPRAAAALCLALLAAPCPAQVVSEPQAFLYVSVPFGAPPAAGLSLRARLDTPARPHVPLMDVRFTGERPPAFRILGMRADAAAPEDAPVNWWIVGGIAAAFVVVVAASNRDEEKKDPLPICQEGMPPPPGGCRPAN